MTTLGEFWKGQRTADARAVRIERVAELVGQGMTDGQIATHLGVSGRTVLRDRQAAGIPSGVPVGSRPGHAARPPQPARRTVPASPRDASAWREDALCAQTDPEVFFPEKGGNVTAAKRVCESCPVRVACLEDALATGDRYGVRGGLSERQRRPLLRTRAKAEGGVAAA